MPGVRSPHGAKGGREARVPSCGPLTPASLGMASLVVWGRLVCLCLKFSDSEFDVRAGLLVGGLVGRLSLHKCIRLAASPAEHAHGTETDGQRMVGCEMPGLGIEVTFSSPHFPWCPRSLCPFPSNGSPTGTLESCLGLGIVRGQGLGLLRAYVWSCQLRHDLQKSPYILRNHFAIHWPWQPDQTAKLPGLTGCSWKHIPALGRRWKK